MGDNWYVVSIKGLHLTTGSCNRSGLPRLRKWCPSGTKHCHKITMSEEHRKKYFPIRDPKIDFLSFYKVKDGDDCLRKTLTFSATTGTAGTLFALLAGLTSTTIDNPALGSNLLIRLAKYGLPMFAAGGMYTATTCCVANIRGGKDDQYNHFLAGLATGSVFGTAFKSHKLGWGLGFAFAFTALVLRVFYLEGAFDNISRNNMRREKGFTVYNRSFLTPRPDPEGDQNV